MLYELLPRGPENQMHGRIWLSCVPVSLPIWLCGPAARTPRSDCRVGTDRAGRNAGYPTVPFSWVWAGAISFTLALSNGYVKMTGTPASKRHHKKTRSSAA
jgi:hypothetical protein